MRLSGLSLAVILLSTSVAFAQHGGGGGGGEGGSSGGSSGGGSHGGGGGSSSSGGSGGHSSGGGGSSHRSSGSGHSSGSHGSGRLGSKTASVTRTPAQRPGEPTGLLHQPNPALQSKSPAEKRTFFAFLRHPFRRPQSQMAVGPRPPVCRKGPCRVCPAGKVGGGCVAVPVHRQNECRYPGVWNGGLCTPPMLIGDTCSALLREMQRQEQRIEAAEASEQSACAQNQSQACSEQTARRQNEERLYQSALNNYRRCRMGGAVNYRFSGSTVPGYGAWSSYDPFRLELMY
jgi:hypothetical protein